MEPISINFIISFWKWKWLDFSCIKILATNESHHDTLQENNYTFCDISQKLIEIVSRDSGIWYNWSILNQQMSVEMQQLFFGEKIFLPISDWPLLIQATYSLTFDTLTASEAGPVWLDQILIITNVSPSILISANQLSHTQFFSIFPTTLQLGKWKILSIKSCSEGFWSDKMIAEMSNIFVQLVYLLKLFSLVLQKYLVAYHQQPILFVYLQLINCLRMPPVPLDQV